MLGDNSWVTNFELYCLEINWGSSLSKSTTILRQLSKSRNGDLAETNNNLK